MAHDIYEQRFVAVREPAWHRLGVVFDKPVLPSRAVEVAGLDLGAEVVPLVVRVGDRLVDTDLVSVGRRTDDQGWVSYGVAKEFTVVQLRDLLPSLDAIQYPLSAAGTLAKGGEVFFTFDAGATDVAGEEYHEYVVFRHSYTPGVAQQVMWTPVRTVCRNTLITGESAAKCRIAIAHDSKACDRTKAALAVTQAVTHGKTVKARLERLAKVQVSAEQVADILRQVYAPYVPNPGVLDMVSDVQDTVDEATLRVLVRPAEAARRYSDRLCETAIAAYERFNDEYPNLAGTAYAVLQAVTESADWRHGRESVAESALVGVRANEKARAWRLLSALAN